MATNEPNDLEGVQLDQVELVNGTLKIGEQFDYPDPDFMEDPSIARNTRYMIDETGKGPFTLLGVSYFERSEKYMLNFKDRHGANTEVTSDYFCKI